MQAQMLYPELWPGKGDRPGKVPEREGTDGCGSNGDRGDDRGNPAETVYSSTEGNHEICRSTAWKHCRAFHRAQDPCDP